MGLKPTVTTFSPGDVVKFVQSKGRLKLLPEFVDVLGEIIDLRYNNSGTLSVMITDGRTVSVLGVHVAHATPEEELLFSR